MRISSAFIVPAAALALATLSTDVPAARAEDKPSVIRVAFPGVGNGNRPYVGGGSYAVMHLRGMLEEEFKADGIKVTWSFLRGAGPAVNELYANGLVDFSLLGDLPSVVGRAGGLRTRVLAASGIRQNSYLAVPADSNINSIKDLRGKKVAIFKGTNIQLAVAKILEANGMTEKDIRAMNMDTATSTAALITKDVDAVFGAYNLFGLRDQGVARIIYSTEGDSNKLRHASWIGTEEFITKYPEITKRVVKTLVKAAKWISDNEKTPNTVYQLYAKSGYRYVDFKEDTTRTGQSLKALSSPLLDPYIIAQYDAQVAQAKKYGLIKNTFSTKSWFEPRFLDAALKELGLENFWQPVDAQGRAQASASASVPAGAQPIVQAAAAP